MLTDRLKEQTKQNHQLLEKKLVNQMRDMTSDEQYIQLLNAFYSYFGGLEVMISKSLDASVLPDYPERRKAQALADDLESFKAVVPELAVGTDLPEINNTSQALGALYVIEGSTLGGQIISQMIKKQLGSTTGLSFFEGYGSETMEKWLGFKTAVNTAPRLSEEQLIETANQTFTKFADWLLRAS